MGGCASECYSPACRTPLLRSAHGWWGPRCLNLHGTKHAKRRRASLEKASSCKRQCPMRETWTRNFERTSRVRRSLSDWSPGPCTEWRRELMVTVSFMPCSAAMACCHKLGVAITISLRGPKHDVSMCWSMTASCTQKICKFLFPNAPQKGSRFHP